MHALYRDGVGFVLERKTRCSRSSVANLALVAIDEDPGDIIVGDPDGIVVVNPADAPDVLAKATAQNAKEAEIMKDIESLVWDRAWVDATLKAKGCEFID